MSHSRPKPRAGGVSRRVVPPRTPRGTPWLAILSAVLLATMAVWLWWPGRTAGRPSGGPPVRAEVARPIVEPEAEVFARYAGSASCRECHTNAFNAWAVSNHGLAERVPSAALDQAAFEPRRSFAHGTQTTEVGMGAGAGGYEVTAKGVGGQRAAHAVERVIGHYPLRQYLVPAPGGRWQTLEASWDPRTNEWFNVYGAEDRQPGEWGHWTGRGMNWNSMCGTCHNTRFRKNYVPQEDRYHSTMAEMTVGCESCHGPQAEHVRWQRAWLGKGQIDPTLRKRTPAQHMETCAPCHARRSELTGDVVAEDSFWDHYLLAIVDETDVFYPDGQVREEDYEYTAFLGSRMHAAGVTCLDCHDPHAARPKLAGNDLCMRCHNGSRQGSPVIDPARHTFHLPGGTGSQCVNCHMPQTVYMARHSRHDHGFTSPDPWLTREHAIPNACNRCHLDKDTAWALEACDRWYGARMERPARRRTHALASARRGDEAAVAPLLAMLDTPETPYWKASAVALLDRWVGQAGVQRGLLKALDDGHPLVRYRAVQGLAPLVEAGEPAAGAAVRATLGDSARAVRVSAAWALRSSLDLQSGAGRELAHMLALNADQPAGQAQLGALALAQGRPDAAAEALSRAVLWDPGSPGFRHDYGVALSQLGRSQEALVQIREAARLEPRVAENHFRLGLAWSEAGDLAQASAALEEAVRLDPRHERALYNLGLAYEGLGRRELALDTLQRAEAADPRDPRIPYARATVLAQAGRAEEAGQAARRALELQPGFRAAAELLRMLR